jgi:hypothetical protein
MSSADPYEAKSDQLKENDQRREGALTILDVDELFVNV